MSKRRSPGQRRAGKVVARRKRDRGLQRGCPRGPHPVARMGDVAPASPVDDSVGETPPAHAAESGPREALADIGVPDTQDEVVRALLVEAVARTVAEPTPTVGRSVADWITELDEEYEESVELDEFLVGLSEVDPRDESPSEAARFVLVSWLRAARKHDGGGETARQVVAWVADHLGRSGPAIEQQAIHLGGPGAPRPLDLTELLSDDLTAVLVWLVSGLVAVAGDSDVAWLDLLDSGRSSGHTAVGPFPGRIT